MSGDFADGWTRAALVVGAVALHDGAVLLVHEHTLRGAGPDQWTLPGGRVERSELFDAAVKREVAEETGLVVRTVGPLAFGTQHFAPGRDQPLLFLAFHVDVEDPAARCTPNDPDGLIMEARFVPIPEAIELVRSAGVSPGTQSAIDFLTHPDAHQPSLWLWDLNISDKAPMGRIPAS